MSIETAKENLKALKEKKEEAEKKLREEFKKEFLNTVKALFEAYPKLKSFDWTQHTPYFKDGDPCVFGANIAYMNVVTEGCELTGDKKAYRDEGDIHYDLKEIFEEEKDKDGNTIWRHDRPEGRSYYNLIPKPEEGLSERQRIVKDVYTLLDSIDNDTYLGLFGDHKIVNVSPEGIDVIDNEGHD